MNISFLSSKLMMMESSYCMSDHLHRFYSKKTMRDGLFIYEFSFPMERIEDLELVEELRLDESNMFSFEHANEINENTMKEDSVIYINDKRLMKFWLEQPHFMFEDNKIFIISLSELNKDIKIKDFVFHFQPK